MFACSGVILFTFACVLCAVSDWPLPMGSWLGSVCAIGVRLSLSDEAAVAVAAFYFDLWRRPVISCTLPQQCAHGVHVLADAPVPTMV